MGFFRFHIFTYKCIVTKAKHPNKTSNAVKVTIFSVDFVVLKIWEHLSCWKYQHGDLSGRFWVQLEMWSTCIHLIINLFASFYHPMNFFNKFYGIYMLRRRKTQTSNIQVVLTYYKLFRLVSHKVVWLIFVISLARLKSFIYSRLMHLTNTLMSKQLIE